MFSEMDDIYSKFSKYFGISSSGCFCTQAPCPQSGYNFLATGAGSMGTYYYVTHGSSPVVSSASITITSADLDTGSETSDCTREYSRSLDDVRKI
jgi:hypothetical protein